jgi:hypothetical protein
MMLALWTAVTRKPGDLGRSLLGDDLEALDHAGYHGVFEAGVEILGVLADDDEVDVLKP